MAYAPIPWSEAGSPITWSTIGINWNTAAKGNSVSLATDLGETLSVDQGIGFSITFGADLGQTLSETPIKTESVTMALTAAQAVGHDHTLAASAIFGTDLTSTAVTRLDAVEAITFAVSDVSTLTPGTTFTDEETYPVTVGMSGESSLLWQQVGDVVTVWTKVDYPN